MRPREAGPGLGDADVADVDAGADPRHVPEALGHLDEPVELQPGGVLEEQRRPVGRQAELVDPGDQVARPGAHLGLVVDDEAGDPPREAVGERLDRRPAPLVQQVDVPAQVHDGPVGLGRREPENPLELLRRVGVELGGQPGLGEAETGQPQQGVVAVDPTLEQGPQRRTRGRWFSGDRGW
jgi:hypothetical protein